MEDQDFPFGSRRLYGAPHRLGWQMINELYLDDVFDERIIEEVVSKANAFYVKLLS